MQMVMVVLRTVFFVFLTGYTGRGLPMMMLHTPRTFDEQYSLCANNLAILMRGIGFALAWLFFETAIGWWSVLRKKRPKAPEPIAPKPPVAQA